MIENYASTKILPSFPAIQFRAALLLEGAALYLLCFTLLAVLIFTHPSFVGNDDYYHARLGGEIIDQGRLAIDFPWLPQTILSADKFVDHHLLYHIYLAPWVEFGGIEGAKLAQVVIAAAIFVAMWWMLHKLQVRWATLWTLALFGLSEPFLYRTLMIRTQGASVLLLVIALHLLFQRRFRWLVPLSFAYAWLYDGFILMPAFAALYVAGLWFAEKHFDWRPVAYAVLGIGLGLVINPYFPRNIIFILDHLGAKVDFAGGIQVGSEWYPYTTGVLMANSGGALLILLIGFLRSSVDSRRRDVVENTLLFAALITLFMLFRSRRFIEYYPPFALLFCAAVWGRNPEALLNAFPRRIAVFVPIAVLAVMLVFTIRTFMQTRHTLKNSDDPRWFVGASNWLQHNTPQGTLVFQTDWDDFTRLFYYNTSSTYLVGLDPTYLQLADPELWDQWVAITRGEVDQPSASIAADFGSHYIISDANHDAFADRANDDPNMKLVYWDQNSLVWQIIDSASIRP